jgi:hypothetical protein
MHMCEASIYVKHRVATARESLVVQVLPAPWRGMKGLYPQTLTGDPDKDCLVCIKKSTRTLTKAVIVQLDFDDRTTAPPEAYAFEGAHNVPVTLRHSYYRGDWVGLPDGTEIPMACLAIGTKVEVGMKPVKTEEGVAAIKAALVEQDKTMPVPADTAEGVVRKVIRRAVRRPRATNRID